MQAAIVTFDHLALWALGCYGNTWVRTPRFDQLAADSVVFDCCYAAPGEDLATSGLAALADRLHQSGGAAISYSCGDRPAMTDDLRRAIADWQRASASGRPALLWLQCPAVASPWQAPVGQISAAWHETGDADAQFDTLKSALTACGASPPDRTGSPDSWIAAALPLLVAGGLLERRAIAATPGIGALRRIVYAAAVTALDAWLGEVLDLLETGSPQNTLLVVAAAAGDLAGPHAELAAGCPPLIEPLVHVPLLIRTGTDADGTRRGALTSFTDITPTLAEWFALEPISAAVEATRQSLWPILRDDARSLRDDLFIGSVSTGWSLRSSDFACLCGPAAVQGDLSELSATSPDQPRLFVKPDDAWDTLDVATQHPDVTARMMQHIRERAHRTPDV